MAVYEIKPTPSQGLGVFASQPIKCGERILSEKPFLTVPGFLLDFNVERVYQRVCALPINLKEEFLKLHATEMHINLVLETLRVDNPGLIGTPCVEAAAILGTNGFEVGSSEQISGAFLTASQFNHSCCPNAWYAWNERTEHLTFPALPPPPANEEITIAYQDPLRPRRQRQKDLIGFKCTCPACDVDSDMAATRERAQASEKRRERICRLNIDLRFFFERNLRREGVGPLSSCVVDGGVEQPFGAVEEVARLADEEELAVEDLTKW